MRQLQVAGLLLVLLLRCSGNAFAKQLSWSLPVVELKVPASHAVQWPWPRSAALLPGRQAMQSLLAKVQSLWRRSFFHMPTSFAPCEDFFMAERS